MMIVHVDKADMRKARLLMLEECVIRGDLVKEVAQECYWIGMRHEGLKAAGIENRMTWENA